jgi:PAS domain S-box-containing protein
VVAIDVTQKIRYEQALINSERRFKTLIQEGADLISIMDPDGYCRYVSPTTVRVLRTDPQELIGQNLLDLVHDLDREEVASKFDLLTSTKRIELAPFRYLGKDNKIHWIEAVITDMREDVAIAGIVCNARVVTERVENELKIKEHLERYNRVSEATSDCIWDIDMASHRIVWNRGIKVVFGYDEVEYTYKWWRERVHTDDVQRVTQIVENSINQKISRWTSQYRFRCADGAYKDVLDRGFLIFDDESGQPVRMIGAMQDISDQVAYTKAVEAHNVRLKEITWTQAHLLRAPLARILGLIPLLDDLKAAENANTEILSYLEASASELDEIVKQVINKSHEALKSS